MHRALSSGLLRHIVGDDWLHGGHRVSLEINDTRLSHVDSSILHVTNFSLVYFSLSTHQVRINWLLRLVLVVTNNCLFVNHDGSTWGFNYAHSLSASLSNGELGAWWVWSVIKNFIVWLQLWLYLIYHGNVFADRRRGHVVRLNCLHLPVELQNFLLVTLIKGQVVVVNLCRLGQYKFHLQLVNIPMFLYQDRVVIWFLFRSFIVFLGQYEATICRLSRSWQFSELLPTWLD